MAKSRITCTYIPIALVWALSASVINGQTPAQTYGYTALEAAKHMGENATITDRIDGVYQSSAGDIFLSMGGKYPNQLFTAFIPSARASGFFRIQQYEGKIMAVSGRITSYKGKPEILIGSPSQLEVIRERENNSVPGL
jgi:hypothetical protein